MKRIPTTIRASTSSMPQIEVEEQSQPCVEFSVPTFSKPMFVWLECISSMLESVIPASNNLIRASKFLVFFFSSVSSEEKLPPIFSKLVVLTFFTLIRVTPVIARSRFIRSDLLGARDFLTYSGMSGPNSAAVSSFRAARLV